MTAARAPAERLYRGNGDGGGVGVGIGVRVVGRLVGSDVIVVFRGAVLFVVRFEERVGNSVGDRVEDDVVE
jgi:hypothetical protein